MEEELWGRFKACGFTPAEVCRLRDLLNRKVYEDGELVALVSASGDVLDLDWSDVPGWEEE